MKQAPREQSPAEQALRSMAKNEARPVDWRGGLAPWAAIDRYPIVQGSNISLAYVASAARLCLTGYRHNWVDVLSELLDQEPHGFSVLTKRVLGVAGGRIEVTPAPSEDSGEKAKEIALHVERTFRRIPYRTEKVAHLMWSTYTGLAGHEMFWTPEAGGWRLRDLRPIHSRRLSLPRMGDWDVYVWDQGFSPAVTDAYGNPGEGSFQWGVRCADYPGKFLIHSPKLRAEYVTREGLGWVLATYMCLKRLCVRGGGQWFERFFKPWVIATYNTIETEGAAAGKDRNAETADQDIAETTFKGLGSGSGSGALLPSSVKIELVEAVKRFEMLDFAAYLDAAMSKAVLGQTHTTEPGPHGNRNAGEVAKRETMELHRYDAACFSDTLLEQLVKIDVALNFPGCEDDLLPGVKLVVERPDPREIVEVACLAADRNVPVDADEIGRAAGLPLTPKKKGETGEDDVRRMMPLKPVEVSAAVLDGDEELVEAERASKIAGHAAVQNATSGGEDDDEGEGEEPGPASVPAKKSDDDNEPDEE